MNIDIENIDRRTGMDFGGKRPRSFFFKVNDLSLMSFGSFSSLAMLLA